MSDPRQIDPENTEADESDLEARGKTSDAPERDPGEHDDDRAEALAAMPEADGTGADQVESRQPDSEPDDQSDRQVSPGKR